MCEASSDVVVPADQRVMHGSLSQVLHCILSHLPVADVGRVSSVCSTWNQLANKNHLWWELCHRDQITLQDGTLIQEEMDQGCDYKCVYKQYSLTLNKWMTGEGVSMVRKTLLTPNGRQFKGDCLAVCSRYILAHTYRRTDTNIYVFSAATGVYLHRLTGLSNTFPSVIVSKDETISVAYSHKGSIVCVWQIDTGECLHSLKHPHNVCSIALHETMLAVGIDEYPVVFVWNIGSGELQRKLCCPHPHELVMDGQHIAIYNDMDSVVQLWDVNTGTHSFTWNHTGHCAKVLLDWQSRSLVGLMKLPGSRSVCVWNTETGVCRGSVQAPNNQRYTDMMLHDGTLVIATKTMGYSPGFLLFSQVLDLRATPVLVQSMMDECNIEVTGGDYRIHAVCKELIIMASVRLGENFVSLWHLKQNRFVRRVDVGGETIVGINVLFNKFQTVRCAYGNNVRNRNNVLTYVMYDFSS